MATAETIARLGGSLCLDFANTVEPRNADPLIDVIAERDDVLRWGAGSGLVDRHCIPGGRAARSGLSEAAAAEELARARALREAIFGVFGAVAHGREPDASALGLVQRAFAQAMTRSELAVVDGAYTWRSSAGGVDVVLDAVARDAVDLLRSPRRSRIKQCGAEEGGCGWLFVDATKSGTRRWCTMAVCGSRAKASRHRARRTLPQ